MPVATDLAPDGFPDTMRAAVLHARRDLRVEEVARPDPERGELLLEIEVGGICGTDAHEYAAGPVMFPLEQRHPVTDHLGPMVLGHELAGRVVAVGAEVDPAWLGRQVVTGGGYSCERCHACATDRPNLCPEYATVGLNRDGGLAHYCAVPVRACQDASDAGLHPDVAALAQPTAIAIHAMRRGRVAAHEQVVIVGCGGIGAFLVAACADAGAHVTAIDLDDERLRVAAALGADRTLRGDGDQPLSEVVAGDRRRPPDVVFEVTGAAAVLEALLEERLLGTRIVTVGLQDGALPVAFRPLALRENEVIGTNALVRSVDLPLALRLLSDGGFDWTLIAPVVLPLDELVAAGLEPLASGGPRPIKTLIDPWASERRPATSPREERP